MVGLISYVNSPMGWLLPFTVTVSIWRTRERNEGDKRATKSWERSRGVLNCLVAASRREAMFTLGER